MNKTTRAKIAELHASLETGSLSRREFLRFATLLGVAAPAAYALAGLTLPQLARAAAPTGGTMRFSQRVHQILTPHSFEWGAQSNMGRQSLEYLAVTGADNITRPHLLSRWEVSEDLRTWDLHLRPAARWRNGRPFLADDVIWNLRHVLDPATGSSVLGLMSYLLGEQESGKGQTTLGLWDANAIEKLDDHRVRLNLRQPQLAVPEHLFHYPLVMLDPEEGGEFKPGSNATGPFTFQDISVGEAAFFTANRDYWGDVKPRIEAVRFLDSGDDFSVALAALISDQVDGIEGIDLAGIEVARKDDRLVLYEVATAQTAVARMKPLGPFADPRVRKAMRLAIDTPRLLQIAHMGLGLPGEHHHICSIHPDYPALPFMKQDIDAARRLLADAGYADGLQTEISVPNTSWEVAAVVAMKDQWEVIGVDVKINVMPGPLYWDVWKDVPFGFTSWHHRPLGVMTLALAYRTGVPWNESDYSNPEFDRLLDEAEGTLDLEARRAIMARIAHILQEEGPIVQPLWRSVFTAMSKRVQDFKMHPTSVFNFNEIALA